MAPLLGLSEDEMKQLIRGDLAVDANLADRLALAFEISAQTWLNLQVAFDRAKSNSE